MKQTGRVIILTLCFAVFIPGVSLFSQAPVCLSHLDFMKEDRVGMSTVWLYSDYPRYERLRDAGEGAACVDDNARAVVTYCRYFEATGDTNALVKAENIAKFVEYMHANPDNPPFNRAEFYNFIWENGSINTGGPTSQRAFGSYASRACWAMGYGYQVFRSAGRAYFNTLGGYMINEFRPRIQYEYTVLGNNSLHGYNLNAMLFNNANNAGTALMGLLAWRASSGDGSLDTEIQRTLMAFTNWQFGDINTFPFRGIFTKIDNVTWLQGYGAYSVAALAYGAEVYNNPGWLARAKEAADYFYLNYLTSIYPGNEGRNPAVVEYPQIAFAVAPMVEGCYRIYRASRALGEASSEYLKYARYAGLFASYFTGNNVYGIPAYDPATGICFDGIESPENPVDSRVNRNSGGESTVETLNSLLLVLTDTNCRSYAYAREQERHSAIILEAEDAESIQGGSVQSGEWFGDFVSGQMFSKSEYVQLSPGGSLSRTFYTEKRDGSLSDNYLLYLCYAKRTAAGADTVTVAVDGVPAPFYTGGSPDSDFLFFARMTNGNNPRIYTLPPGRHTVQITAGSKTLILDQIVVQPVLQRKTFRLPDSSLVTVDRPFLAPGPLSSAPGGLSVTPVNYGNTLRIDWATAGGILGYNIYRKSSLETAYSKVNARPVPGNYYIDNGLAAGETYTYKVTAISNPLWQESLLSQGAPGTALSPLTVDMKLTETENDWSVEKNGIYFSSTLYNGFAETRAYDIDVDGFPDITASVNNPTDTYWSLSALRWIPEGSGFYTFEEVPLQESTRDTGRFTYNLRSLFGWTGHQILKFRFSLSRNNLSTFLEEISIGNRSSGALLDVISSPQLFFSSDGVTPAYYVPDVNLDADEKTDRIVYAGNASLENLELSLSKIISADLSHYKSLAFRISSANEWALECVVNNETLTVSPYTKKTGPLFFNLRESTGKNLTGLTDMLLRFRVRTSGPVSLEISGLKFSSSPVPFFSSYEGVRGVPNPFTPSSSDERFNRMIFYFDRDFGKTGIIRIFGLDGRLVRKIDGAVPGETFWDGADEDGRPACSGLYIFQVKTEGRDVQTGSVVVIR